MTLATFTVMLGYVGSGVQVYISADYSLPVLQLQMILLATWET